MIGHREVVGEEVIEPDEDIPPITLSIRTKEGICLSDFNGRYSVGSSILTVTAISKGVAKTVPTDSANAYIDQVLHEDVLNILRAAAASLNHRKAGLHEHHQRTTDDEIHVGQLHGGLRMCMKAAAALELCHLILQLHRPFAEVPKVFLQGGEALLLRAEQAL